MRKPRSKRERMELLGTITQNELNRAEGGDNDEVQANREMALDYYFARPRGDEVENRSQVISTDVADMTNACLAMLVPMLSTDAVVEFEPEGEEDEQQAHGESQAVNKVIIEDNRGFIEIQEAVKDALLLKNGCLKIHVDESQSVQTFDITGVNAEQRNALMMFAQPNQTVEIDGDDLTMTTTRRRFEVNAVPIENICYQAGYTGNLQDIRFFAERIMYTRSDLVEMGIDKKVVDKLQPYSETITGTERARNQGSGKHSELHMGETRDQDIIDCHEVYVRVDMDGDGISERYKCLVANQREVLEYEQFDLLPYAIGSPFLNSHRITGESLFDHLKMTQDAKTALQRQLIDNVSIINNGRYVYDPARTAEDDVLRPTAGGGIRSRDPGNAVVPVMVPDVATGILSALAYEDQRRTERGGASLDMLSADAQLVGETAHGIERQYGAREALVAMMAKNLSETLIRDIYILTHEFMRRFATEPVRVQVAGQSVPTNPSEWPQRNRVNVKTGMTPGQRGHLQLTLMQAMQLQVQAMTQGMSGQLADPGTVFRTYQDWLRMAGADNPERYAINPMSPKAQQAAQQASQAAQEQARKTEQLVQTQLQLEIEKIRSEERQHSGDLRHKYYDTDMEAAIAEAKIAGSGVIELEKTRMTNETKGQGGSADGATRSAGGSK